jgi:hypothetical protein
VVREVRQHHCKEEPPEHAECQPGEERATGGDKLASLECPKDETKDSTQHEEEQKAGGKKNASTFTFISCIFHVR